MPISKIMQKKFTSLNTLPSLMQKKNLDTIFWGKEKGRMGGETFSGWWFQPRLKNISQIASSPQVGMKLKNIWNHLDAAKHKSLVTKILS